MLALPKHEVKRNSFVLESIFSHAKPPERRRRWHHPMTHG
jgi:hypothetical protein